MTGVSCLMVTRPQREHLAARSIACFLDQSVLPRELLVVHSGDEDFGRRLAQAGAGIDGVAVRTVRASDGWSLGRLRNLAVDSARFDLVCQWDDDDLYHPGYLAAMGDCLARDGAAFCFLADQFHWYSDRGFVFWEDHGAQFGAYGCIEGTLFGRRHQLPPYADLAAGEDTALLHEILRGGCRVTRLAGEGWRRVYTFHGGNTFARGHHAAISRARRLGKAALLERVGSIAAALGDHRFDGDTLKFPHDDGWLLFRRRQPGGPWDFAGNERSTA